MRIVRFELERLEHWGVLVDGVVWRADGEPFVDLRPAEQVGALGDVRLLAPVRPRSVMCIGRNYADHASELGNEVPEEPLVFSKPVAAVIGPGAAIERPPMAERVDHEAELVVVIGAVARRVRRSEAASVIGGYTLGNDVTARDLQHRDGQWTRGKGFDTFCPLGPWVDTEIDPAGLRLTCTVDGELRQDGSLDDLVFDIPSLVAYVTSFTTLVPGDVIMTGTPAGVGPLDVGQTVTVAVDGLGELSNPVVDGA